MLRHLRWAVCAGLVAATPQLAVGQRAGSVHPAGATALRTASAPAVIASLRGAPLAATPAIAGSSAVGLAARAALGVVSGAVVGGWLGYFTSQVTRSDWDALPNDQKATVRRSYMVSGASVGAVVGYFMRPRLAPAPEGLAQPEGVPLRTGRLLITAKELHRSVATTALEAVEMERPEWISSLRDDQRRGEVAEADAKPEMASVPVYVGDVQVGKLETLRDMSIPEVAELRFYSARDARKRWGVEHKYGAIEVVPASAAVAAGHR